ncbi:hypothetical protein ANCCAN_02041 [Ancylostoma caninum]|uniref:Uncharacterized protein n=1 Tax=Ancylostoma caninum TaxID=29170 RepID=A0A368H501_ANCCA|nr:hypothetical protein ANCCAN_02041 [Ancylostoma caninum]
MRKKLLSAEVLRRAEASRREAKVVVDARHLRRYGRVRRPSAEPERQYSVEEIQDDSMDRGDLVQMDSIPEDLTVSLSPHIDPSSRSRQHSWISGSESDWSQRTLKSRIETFGRRLSNWFNTLDYDGDYMNFQLNIEPPKTASLEQGVSSFVDVLSTGVVILALLELYESSLQSSFTLHSYCEGLCNAVFNMIYADLKRYAISHEEHAAIDAFCSKLVLHIFTDIWLTALDAITAGVSTDADEEYTGTSSINIYYLVNNMDISFFNSVANFRNSKGKVHEALTWQL